MSYADFRRRSHPIRLNFAGWESDTATLQHHGWQIESHEDISCRQIMLAVHHPDWSLSGLSERVNDWDWHRPIHISEYPMLHMGMRALGKTINIHEGRHLQFKPVDCEPSVETSGIISLEDLCHFRPRVLPAKSIYVAEPSVDELLQRILEKQDPDRQRYYAEKAREDRALKQVHAQIISLGDYRDAA